MKVGIIVKLIAGSYTIKDENGNKIILKPRGVFRHRDIAPKVGDIVNFDDDLITEVKPRKNDLIRPPVANVDQAILIHAAKEPNFSFNLLDRFLILVEKEDILPIIIVTKIDLLQDVELKELKNNLSYYEEFYPVYYTSVKDETSLKVIEQVLENKTSVFAGQTGAGKSSLLNVLDINLKLETGEISKALGRGRHTTRHSELIDIYGGLVADTPGFSKLDFEGIEASLLQAHYPDFVKLSSGCKFRGCTHLNEPKCAVKDAYKDGKILKSRYENYQLLYQEISEQKKRY